MPRRNKYCENARLLTGPRPGVPVPHNIGDLYGDGIDSRGHTKDKLLLGILQLDRKSFGFKRQVVVRFIETYFSSMSVSVLTLYKSTKVILVFIHVLILIFLRPIVS